MVCEESIPPPWPLEQVHSAKLLYAMARSTTMSNVTGTESHLKTWLSELRFDFPASISVTLIAIPLCLGIALACGVPLSAGLIAGVLGGVLVGWLSGSHTSVSGPAAGLTAVVLAAMHQFDNAFTTLLVAIVLAGAIQIILGILRAGIIASLFPNSVISGMLAAIGLILIFKQIPHAFGYDADPEGDFSFFQSDSHNTFSELIYMAGAITPTAMVIAIVCLIVIVSWEKAKLEKKLMLPSALAAVVVGTLINLMLKWAAPSYVLAPNHLVHIPAIQSLADAWHFLTFPNWSMVGDRRVWIVALELAFIASLETLLNLEGIDKLDPLRRRSPPNRELVAQGVGNVVSGLIGGLPITSVVVRSSANVSGGAVSKKSTVMHGLWVAGCVVVIPGLLNQIPLAALAAILLVTGYKLAGLKTFLRFYKRGWNQFVPFLITVLAILFTDLLIGVIVGLTVGLLFVVRRNMTSAIEFEEERHAPVTLSICV